MSTVLCLSALAVLAYILFCMFNKKNIADGIIFSFMILMAVYTVLGTLMLILEKFSVNRCLMAILVIAVLLAAVIMISGKKPKISFVFGKEYMILAISSVLLLVGIIAMKSGVYDISGIFGKAQTKALLLSHGYSETENNMILNSEQLNNANPVITVLLSLGTVLFGYKNMFIILPVVLIGVVYCFGKQVIKLTNNIGIAALITVIAELILVIVCVISSTNYKTDWNLINRLNAVVEKEDIVVLDNVPESNYIQACSILKGTVISKEDNIYNDNKLYDQGKLYYVEKNNDSDEYTVSLRYTWGFENVTLDDYDAHLIDQNMFYTYVWMVLGIIAAVCTVCAGIWGILEKEKRAFVKKRMPYIFLGAVILGVISAMFVHIAIFGMAGGIIYGIVSLFSVIVSGIGIAFLLGKADIVEVIILSVVENIFAYMLSSAVLIGLNAYSIAKAVLIMFVVVMILDGISIICSKKHPKITFDWKKNIVPAVISACVFPLVLTSNGVYGVGQDEGVYQAKALCYVYGYNDNFFGFEEYDQLSYEAQKDYESNLYEYQLGFNYFIDDEQGFKIGPEVPINDVYGSFHGIHTYSSLLALFTTMAGVSNMNDMGVWILVLSIFVLWFIMSRLKYGIISKIMGMILFAISPVVLWQARTTLVETTIALFILAYIYFITQREEHRLRWLAFIPILVFAVSHITIYVYMPLFIIVFYILYFLYGKKRYIASAIITTVGYLAGFYIMYYSSLTYVYGNYNRLYIGGINETNIKKFVTVVSIIVILISAVVAILPVKGLYPVLKNGKKDSIIKKQKIASVVWNVIVRLAVIVAVFGIIYVIIKRNGPVSYLSIYAYCLNSGIIIIPVILITALIRPGILGKTSNGIILSIMFYYCVIIYSTMLYREVLYYYYYSRYLVPYISVVIIMGTYLIDRTGLKLADRFKIFNRDNYYRVCAFAMMLVYILILPSIAVVSTQQDQTQIQWSTLNKLKENLNDESAMIIPYWMSPYTMIQLKVMTGTDVFIQKNGGVDLVSELKGKYKNLYVLTDDEKRYRPQNADVKLRVVDKEQQDVKMPEPIQKLSDYIPYAEEFVVEWRNIALYRCNN